MGSPGLRLNDFARNCNLDLFALESTGKILGGNLLILIGIHADRVWQVNFILLALYFWLEGKKLIF